MKQKRRMCSVLDVPASVCYMGFVKRRGKNKYNHSFSGTTLVEKGKKFELVGEDFYTARGEMLVLDFNKKNEVIGIELVDGVGKRWKRCQS